MLKTLGIALLFLLCVGAGFLHADRLETRSKELARVRDDCKTLLLYLDTRRMPLPEAVGLLPKGLLTAALNSKPLTLPAENVLSAAERQAVLQWLRLLEQGSGREIASEGKALLQLLQEGIDAAKAQQRQAGMFRTLGALCGAVLAILLW